MKSTMWKENKIGIAITIVLIVIGSTYYFGAGLGKMGPAKETNEVLRNAQIKVDIADGKILKLFVLSSNNALSRLRTDEGSAIPEERTIVIGSEEAKMMREEKLFQKPGDKLTDLFGIDTEIGGILEKTGTMIDDMHFVSAEQFKQIDGETGRVYIVFDDEGAPELHMNLKEDERPPLPLLFAEGNFSNYEIHTIVGITYYPAVLGAEEARMMREDKEFTNIGDELEIRGKKAIVIGVLAKTRTALDMMHITPLDENEPSEAKQ